MKLRRYAAALVLTVALSGCGGAPPPNLTPVGQAAVQATQVIKALDVLRDFAITANAQNPPLLLTTDTRKVVDFHTAAVKTVTAVPAGWKATVQAGLTQLQADLPPPVWARGGSLVMPISQTDVNLTNTILTALPGIIGLIKGFHSASATPGASPLTDAQVIAALLSAAAQSIAVDDAWRAAHPSA